jgi:hypothetical protein
MKKQRTAERSGFVVDPRDERRARRKDQTRSGAIRVTRTNVPIPEEEPVSQERGTALVITVRDGRVVVSEE